MMFLNSRIPEKDSVAPIALTLVITRANTSIIDNSTGREVHPTNVRNALTMSAAGIC